MIYQYYLVNISASPKTSMNLRRNSFTRVERVISQVSAVNNVYVLQPATRQCTIICMSIIIMLVIRIIASHVAFEGGVPPDGTPVPQFVTYHLALVIPYYILAATGLTFCTVCLIFNFTQRKKR